MSSEPSNIFTDHDKSRFLPESRAKTGNSAIKLLSNYICCKLIALFIRRPIITRKKTRKLNRNVGQPATAEKTARKISEESK